MDKSSKLLNKKKHRNDSEEESEDDDQSLSDYGKSPKNKSNEKSNKKTEKSESKTKNQKSSHDYEDEEGIIVSSDEVTFMVRKNRNMMLKLNLFNF